MPTRIKICGAFRTNKHLELFLRIQIVKNQPLRPNPKKVVNPYGSTAGAGSGEFHVYRHARAREMQRLATLDEEEDAQMMEQEYQTTLDRYKTEEEERTEKRRKKRKREKEAKMRKKNLKLAGIIGDGNSGSGNSGTANDITTATNTAVEQEEFTYIPVNDKKKKDNDDKNQDKKEVASNETSTGDKETTTTLPFANDGSFLEEMKKRLAAESTSKSKEEDEDDDDYNVGQPKKRQETC